MIEFAPPGTLRRSVEPRVERSLRIASVSVELKSAPLVGEPRSVSKVVINPEPFGTDPLLHTRFDVTPKGDRFLVQTPPDVGIYQLTLVQRWQDRMAR